MKVEVYTDGSATTKDKPGGWAYVVVSDGVKHYEGSGAIPNATNNDAELEAAIQGLASILKSAFANSTDITLVSDSEIILKWANGTYRFKQESKRPKYDQIRWLMNRLKAKTRWVEGHAGHEWNERADKLAGLERDKAMGREPRKKSSKSTLMLRAIKDIAIIAKQGYEYEYDPKYMEIAKLCSPFLGNK